MANDLTQAELKRLVEYDPETGIFRALPGRQGVKPGSVLGVPKNGYLAMYINGGRGVTKRLGSFASAEQAAAAYHQAAKELYGEFSPRYQGVGL